MKIIVGLGNPGAEYARTRHNIGFMVVDRLAKDLTNATLRKRFRADMVEGFLDGEKLVLLAPQTFMNLSGHAVREARSWFHLDLEEILVVYDDMDLPFGSLRVRGSGSAGGHNGLQSIVEQLGTMAVPRLRVGIGRGRSSSTGHVLSRFSKQEEEELPDVIERAKAAALVWIQEGTIAAMNVVNQRPKAEVGSTNLPASEGTPSHD